MYDIELVQDIDAQDLALFNDTNGEKQVFKVLQINSRAGERTSELERQISMKVALRFWKSQLNVW